MEKTHELPRGQPKCLSPDSDEKSDTTSSRRNEVPATTSSRTPRLFHRILASQDPLAPPSLAQHAIPDLTIKQLPSNTSTKDAHSHCGLRYSNHSAARASATLCGVCRRKRLHARRCMVLGRYRRVFCDDTRCPVGWSVPRAVATLATISSIFSYIGSWSKHQLGHLDRRH